jgi:hypothetical protein
MANGVYWKVEPKPTGPYRSFEERGWPRGEDLKGKYLFTIYAENGSSYSAYAVKNKTHGFLRLRFADYSESTVGFKNKTFLKQFSTMEEVKHFAEYYYKRYPEKFINKIVD